MLSADSKIACVSIRTHVKRFVLQKVNWFWIWEEEIWWEKLGGKNMERKNMERQKLGEKYAENVCLSAVAAARMPPTDPHRIDTNLFIYLSIHLLV